MDDELLRLPCTLHSISNVTCCMEFDISTKDRHGDGDGINTAVTSVFTVVTGAIVAVVLREWRQMPREYHRNGVRVCGIPAIMGIGGKYSISKQTPCCKIRKKKHQSTFP